MPAGYGINPWIRQAGWPQYNYVILFSHYMLYSMSLFAGLHDVMSLGKLSI